MNINLIEVTNKKESLSQKTLGHFQFETEEVSSWKILSGYFMDFGAVFTTTFMFSKMLEVAFDNYIPSGIIQSMFSRIPFTDMALRLMPFMFFNYFFFSYFFNHGQSWGLHSIKSRIEMKHFSFRNAFYWAVFSTAVLMTGGLAFPIVYNWMKEKTEGSIKTHDHLYWTLIAQKDIIAVNLLEMTKEEDYSEEKEEDYFQNAA